MNSISKQPLSVHQVSIRVPPTPVSITTEFGILRRNALQRIVDPFRLVKSRTALAWHIDVEELTAEGRGTEYVADVRMVAMTICYRWEIGFSERIAKEFNRRDHGSVLHALQLLPTILTKSCGHRENYLASLERIRKSCEDAGSIQLVS